MALEFSYLSFRGATLGDAVILSSTYGESATDRSIVSGIYRRDAFRPQMLGSANMVWHSIFTLYNVETTQYAMIAWKLDLADYMDGVRDFLYWIKTSDDSVQMTCPNAELIAVEPAPPDSQAAARFTEGLVLSFLSDRPYT